MSHIFVSYATADDALVTQIHDEVEATTGKPLWVDHKDILPGDDWQDMLERALKNSDAFILVMSRNSAERVEVIAEWRAALLYGYRLLIVIADDIPTEAIPYRLRLLHPIRLLPDRAAGIAQLIAAVQRIDASTPVAPDAPAFERSAFTITGDLPARLTRIPMRGRDDDLRRVIDALSGSIVQITGTGGLGKSRLAAEVVLQHGGIDGAVWHTVSDVSRAEAVAELLRLHYDLPTETEWRDLLKHIKARGRLLVVVDNGESASSDARPAYVKVMRDLEGANVGVILTSRYTWDELDDEREYRPSDIDADPAAQIVRDMAAAILPEDRQAEINAQADAIAEAARRHPELIEVAIKQMKKLPLDQVLANLRAFSGRKIDEALDEMLGVSLRQMTDEAGGAPAWALKRLNVTRGGFTYVAAKAIALVVAPAPDDADVGTRNGASDEPAVGATRRVAPTAITTESDLQDALAALVSWSFLIFDGRRYAVDPLAAEYVGEDETARRPHYDFYKALAREHDRKQDYLGLDVESANLEAAFEWALREDAEAAYWLANETSTFLANRGRFTQRLQWAEQTRNRVGEDVFDERTLAASEVSLGIAYQQHPLGDRAGNLRRAVTAYEQALLYSTAENASLDYAMTQNNLGTAYRDLAAVEDRAGNLRRALAAYEQALRFYTPEAAPLDYAMTQNNLGIAYQNLAALEDRAGNLRRAIVAHERALLYRTPEAAPLDYAMTQNNLGTAYGDLAAIEDRVGNLRRAVDAYEQALRFNTPEAAPLDHSLTQENVGLVLVDLAEIENREENLNLAINAYREALRFLTPEQAPYNHAKASHGLGNIHSKLGDIPAAVACWREAERHYRQMGDVENADLMLRGIADAEGEQDEDETM